MIYNNCECFDIFVEWIEMKIDEVVNEINLLQQEINEVVSLRSRSEAIRDDENQFDSHSGMVSFQYYDNLLWRISNNQLEFQYERDDLIEMLHLLQRARDE